MIWVSAFVVFGVVGWYIRLMSWRASTQPVGMHYFIHSRSALPLMVPIAGGLLLGFLALMQDSGWLSWTILGLEIVVFGLVFTFLLLLKLPEHGVTVSVGDLMPAYSLLDQDGSQVSVEAGSSRRPTLYVFYRGHWCPFCVLELRQLEIYYEEIQAHGVELVAISTEVPEASRRLRDRLSVSFRFMSDPGAELLDILGIRDVDEHAREQSGQEYIAFPTMMLVDSTGKIRWIFQTDSVRSRANPQDMLNAVADLMSEGSKCTQSEYIDDLKEESNV